MNQPVAFLWRYPLIVGLAVLIFVPITKADLKFAVTRMDVGEVRAGAPLAQKFTFLNGGPNAIEITDVHTSCGCLTPRLDQRLFQPGDRGSILVEINTLSPAPGPHSWQVELSCRAGTTFSEIPLQVNARLGRDIVVEPAAVAMFVDGGVQSEVRIID